MEVVYEDNHIIVVNKAPGEIVQGDRTGDRPLVDMVKEYIKTKYAKPGNVFAGVVHRLDRPVGGLVIFAKTSKALARLNEMLRRREIHKTYLAIVEGHPATDGATLTDWLTAVERNNKTYVTHPGAKDAHEAKLKYRVLTRGERYSLLEVDLITGRKHQIRVQLAHTGHPIKGDLKYGARRSNPDGCISLLAHRISFVHPVSRQAISLTAPLPQEGSLWQRLMPDNYTGNNPDNQMTTAL